VLRCTSKVPASLIMNQPTTSPPNPQTALKPKPEKPSRRQ